MLCLMWNAPKRGIWKGTYQEFARATGIPWENAASIIAELSHKTSRVTIRDKEVTLENRRMINKEIAYKNNAKRQERYRELHKSDKKVTSKMLDVRLLKTLDVRQKQTTPSASAAPFWKEMVGHINDTWMRFKRGTKYPWKGKDFKALKGLYGLYQPWGVMALWDAYLRSGDTWAADHGYDVSTFSAQIPKIVDDHCWKQAAQSYHDKLEPPNLAPAKELLSIMGAKDMNHV